MFNRMCSIVLLGCGALVLMVGASLVPGQAASPAMAQVGPSPRPTLPPTHTPRNDDEDESSLPDEGHITGTVIDLTSGAPVAGVRVSVAGVLVSTDANGNYDHWLKVGSYPVGLVLAAEQGEPAQGMLMVDVLPGVATVQHLSFRSPAPVLAPTLLPTPAPAGGFSQPAVAMPERLPVTGALDLFGFAWLPIGALLIACGILLWRRPSQLAGHLTQRADHAYLAVLLASRLPRRAPAQPHDAQLLAKLLEVDE